MSTEEDPVHIRIWDRRAEYLGFWVYAYETLSPPHYRQYWQVLPGDRVQLGGNIITYRLLTVNLETKRAEVFHNVRPIPVIYTEALQVLRDLEDIS